MRWLATMMLAACDPAVGPDGNPDPNHLEGLEVVPATATLATGPDGSESADFTAWALLDDGSRVQLEQVAWSVSNSSAGAVDEAGHFVPATDNGGITWVTAEYANTTASATVTVVYHETLAEAGVDPSLFEGQSEPLTPSPWLYPEDGVVLPRGTPSIHFQWADLGAEAYRLNFASPVSDIDVLVRDNGWESEAALWQVIASTNAGGAVEVTLSAAQGGAVRTADPLAMRVNRMDTRGTIFYWTSSLQGVSRLNADNEAEPWWSVTDTGGWCVGCHAISTGADPLLAYSAVPTSSVSDPDAPKEGWLEIRSLADPTQAVLTRLDGQSGDFKSFTPDGTQVIVSLNCQLLLYDARTGDLLADVTPWDEAAGAPLCVAQGEFSPAGDQVALVVTDTLSVSWEIETGSLWLMDRTGEESFGAPRRLADPASLSGPTVLYYPAWSPDGAWLTFNASTGDTYDDEDAELWVVSPEGGAPIRLANANRTAGLTNSWPRWCPLPDDDILWFTFSSRRDYGYVATAGEPQVWVSAFDPALAAQGLDPSASAFWLVGQDPIENNHVPVWVE